GADAVRFTMTSQAVQGRDLKLSISRIEGYRNFVTKIWNAARYGEMNECQPVEGFDPKSCKHMVNRWIVGKTAQAVGDIETAINAYRFNEAADAGYHFTWGNFCDWYIEFSKPIFFGDDIEAKVETRATMAWAFDQILKMLHPIMPFVTEELWGKIAKRETALMLSEWPELSGFVDKDAEAEMDWVVRIISSIRALRSEMNVPPKAMLNLYLKDASAETISRLTNNRDLIHRMARIEQSGALEGEVEKGSVSSVLDEATIILPLAGAIDVGAEAARLEKEIGKLDAEITKLDQRLSNKGFTDKAPKEIVAEQQGKLDDLKAEREKLSEAVERLADL
ncbi:MAG: class I tRNA ligase family protein, partial [Rhodospirillaceae bacterium]|nr:class I tRNA ligase family protein [Rhodospirillaceae bacterium]